MTTVATSFFVLKKMVDGMSKIEVTRVTSKADLKAFIRLPWQIYRNDKYWVAPLLMDMKKILNKKKNPFFHHSYADFFLAKKDGMLVGRIAAIQNNSHNDFHKEGIAFFGFFECIDDQAVADKLFDAAAEWAKSRDLTALRGPANFSSNDTWGFLLEGFDSHPVILMPYNPAYYIDLTEGAGFSRLKQLYAYNFNRDMPIPERFITFAEKQLQDPNLKFRKIDLKDFRQEVSRVREIYNEAWEANWGFVPMNKEEFEHMAEDLRPVVDPDIAYIAEVDGEAAGFSLSIPDYNEILKDLNGRLFPFGLLKLLLNKKKIRGIRVVTLGVRKKFQKKRGLAPTFYYETYTRGKNKGYAAAEFSWILEDNVLMNRALQGLGAKLYKKYAIYEKSLV